MLAQQRRMGLTSQMKTELMLKDRRQGERRPPHIAFQYHEWRWASSKPDGPRFRLVQWSNDRANLAQWANSMLQMQQLLLAWLSPSSVTAIHHHAVAIANWQNVTARRVFIWTLWLNFSRTPHGAKCSHSFCDSGAQIAKINGFGNFVRSTQSRCAKIAHLHYIRFKRTKVGKLDFKQSIG